jgi:hypothetical protein
VADFGPGAAQVLHDIPLDGRYTVEITPTANAPGAFRFQLELVGTLQPTSRALPFDVVVDAPELTVSRQDFSLGEGHVLLLGFQPQSSQPVTWRLRPRAAPTGRRWLRGSFQARRSTGSTFPVRVATGSIWRTPADQPSGPGSPGSGPSGNRS